MSFSETDQHISQKAILSEEDWQEEISKNSDTIYITEISPFKSVQFIGFSEFTRLYNLALPYSLNFRTFSSPPKETS